MTPFALEIGRQAMICMHPRQEWQWVCEKCGDREAGTYDDPLLDGTDGAHPAWWRGDEHGYTRGVAAERKRRAHPDERLQRDIDMVSAALVAERARIAAAVRGLPPRSQNELIVRAAVLAIVNGETP